MTQVAQTHEPGSYAARWEAATGLPYPRDRAALLELVARDCRDRPSDYAVLAQLPDVELKAWVITRLSAVPQAGTSGDPFVAPGEIHRLSRVRAEALRAARRDGRVRARPVRPGSRRYLYSLADARQTWPGRFEAQERVRGRPGVAAQTGELRTATGWKLAETG